MSEAPKKIWVHKDVYSHAWLRRPGEQVCEYVRWDLVQGLIDALKENSSYSSGHAENLAELALSAFETETNWGDDWPEQVTGEKDER